jgi:toxin ParE1/3/4
VPNNHTQRLSKWAEIDLAGIAEYTLDAWGERQTAKYRDILQQGFSKITADPLTPRSKDREELFPGCRSLHVGKHVILYRVKGNVVEVARVLHDSMELDRHIPSEFHEVP